MGVVDKGSVAGKSWCVLGMGWRVVSENTVKLELAPGLECWAEEGATIQAEEKGRCHLFGAWKAGGQGETRKLMLQWGHPEPSQTHSLGLSWDACRCSPATLSPPGSGKEHGPRLLAGPRGGKEGWFPTRGRLRRGPGGSGALPKLPAARLGVCTAR